MSAFDAESVDSVFADPPFNLGKTYCFAELVTRPTGKLSAENA